MRQVTCCALFVGVMLVGSSAHAAEPCSPSGTKPQLEIKLASGRRVGLIRPETCGFYFRGTKTYPGPILTPTPPQFTAIVAALDRLPVSIQSAVRAVGVFDDADPRSDLGANAQTCGATIWLPASFFADRIQLTSILIHEAAHAYTMTLSPRYLSEQMARFEGMDMRPSAAWKAVVRVHFPPELALIAKVRADAFILGGGLVGYFRALHESNPSFTPYLQRPSAAPAAQARVAAFERANTTEEAIEQGLPTAYAVSSPSEEISEWTAEVLGPAVVVRGRGQDPFDTESATACGWISGELLKPPDEYRTAPLLMYAKLNLLADLGYFSRAKLAACVTPPTFEIGASAPGIYLAKPGDTSPSTVFKDGGARGNPLVAGWGPNRAYRGSKDDPSDAFLKVRGFSDEVTRDDAAVYVGPWNLDIGLYDPDRMPFRIHDLTAPWSWQRRFAVAAFVAIDKPRQFEFQSRRGKLVVTRTHMVDGVACDVRGVLLPDATDAGPALFFVGVSLGPMPSFGTRFAWGAFSVRKESAACKAAAAPETKAVDLPPIDQ